MAKLKLGTLSGLQRFLYMSTAQKIKNSVVRMERALSATEIELFRSQATAHLEVYARELKYEKRQIEANPPLQKLDRMNKDLRTRLLY